LKASASRFFETLAKNPKLDASKMVHNYEEVWQKFQDCPKYDTYLGFHGLSLSRNSDHEIFRICRVPGYDTAHSDELKDDLETVEPKRPPSGPRGFATIVMNVHDADSAAKLCVSLRNVCPDCGIMVVTIPGLDTDKM
jgi:hypothetical protein